MAESVFSGCREVMNIIIFNRFMYSSANLFEIFKQSRKCTVVFIKLRLMQIMTHWKIFKCKQGNYSFYRLEQYRMYRVYNIF